MPSAEMEETEEPKNWNLRPMGSLETQPNQPWGGHRKCKVCQPTKKVFPAWKPVLSPFHDWWSISLAAISFLSFLNFPKKGRRFWSDQAFPWSGCLEKVKEKGLEAVRESFPERAVATEQKCLIYLVCKYIFWMYGVHRKGKIAAEMGLVEGRDVREMQILGERGWIGWVMTKEVEKQRNDLDVQNSETPKLPIDSSHSILSSIIWSGSSPSDPLFSWAFAPCLCGPHLSRQRLSLYLHLTPLYNTYQINGFPLSTEIVYPSSSHLFEYDYMPLN